MIHFATPQRSVDALSPPGTISWEPIGDVAEPPSGSDGLETDTADVVDAAPRRDVESQAPASSIHDPVTPPNAAAIAASLGRVPFSVQSLGPVGRRRSPALVGLGGLVTFGLGLATWTGRVNREMAEFDPRMQVRSRRSALAVLLPPLLLLGVAMAAATRIVLVHLGHDVALPVGSSWTQWLILAPVLSPLLTLLTPFSLAAVIMTLERIRVVEDRASVDPDMQLIPARRVGWLVCPIVGALIVAAGAQRRLNRVWRASI